MCLIAYAPKGQLIPREVLSYAAWQNDDGIGVMSSDGVRKYLGNKMLKKARRYMESLAEAGTPYAVHMRWATHGDVTLDNTHPYQSPGKTHYIMHNGIISLTTAESSAEESDTAVYVRKFLDNMPDFEEDKKFYKDVAAHIGYGNKFVIMDQNHRFQICNEDAGIWIDGIWFSNTYSLPANYPPRPKQNYSVGGYYNTARSLYPGYDVDYDDDRRSPYQKGWRYEIRLKCWFNPETHEVVERTWNDGTTSAMLIKRDIPLLEHKPIEKVSNIRSPSGNHGTWSHEDREAYYEALESGLTPTEATQYMDTGTMDANEAGEQAALLALREQQGRELAAAYDSSDKPESPVGGDFPENPIDLDTDDEDQSTFKRYLRAIAATVHV